MASTASEKEDLISVKDLSFQYRDHPVLENINFTIKAGDFLAILGPNGSGKTTLIKIILGLLKPSQGKIRIKGIPVQNFNDWKLVGYVPQKATHFDPYFPASVSEIVEMGMLSGKRKSSRKVTIQAVERALKYVGMANERNRRIGNLSSGQQQRVFIARAIVNQPRILFLDEPTTGVDVEIQDQFYDMLNGLNTSQKMTIVLITHETGIVNKHINQVACLNRNLFYHGTHSEFCQSSLFKKMLDEGHHLILHRH